MGRRLGEYEVLERIGEGGFGKVYRAHQAALSRQAVVKVLHVSGQADEQITRRFTAEAQVASRLDHPYAAHVYGFGAEPDGVLWIAMELVRGAPLDTHVALHGPLELSRFVTFFERVCEVVHSAHEAGIVHRDIKPANIMVLARAGRLLPKLLDFGIAKVLHAVAAPIDRASLSRARTAPVEVDSLDRTAPVETVLDRTARSESDSEILGSPRYMAPEQWASPREITARADLYALGAVAYELLTGRAAFEGATLAAVMHAHERGMPPLPEGFPPALDAVLARATARQPEDRFANALELAEAIRGATGKRPLPQLSRELAAHFIARAPEPLAEAVHALDSAENAHALRDGIVHVARAATRWLALLAISSRTRVGPGTDESAEVARALRTLRRDGLRDREWLELAREITRPFGSKRETHPIPELVALFVPEHDEPDGGALLARLLAAHGASEPGEAQLRARVPDLLSQLAAALTAIWFVTEYDVVVPRGARAERLAGSRRGARATVPADGLGSHLDHPVLLDAEATPVLVLWPLVQYVAPSVGAEPELFLFEGPGRHGARLVAPRHGFEHHDASLWDWFSRSLLADDDPAAAAAVEDAPYRGLASFTESDAHLFFGREREIDQLVNRLRVTPLIAVVGPSGVGKSSFVQAGVLPALGWSRVVMRPGRSPFAVLAARLEVAAAELERAPERLGQLLRERAQASGGVVLVIDQLEELFTLCLDAGTREAFARALVLAATTAEDRVRVIVTLRDDFLMRAESIPPLRDRIGSALHLLGTPGRADLIRILVEPARKAGYTFEDDALADEMVDDVADRPGALALLSFTAAALWELRDRHFRQLVRSAYHTLGGVGGALARHAEATLQRMPADQRALVRAAMRRLVTADGTRAVMARAELVQVLGEAAKAEAVIEVLVGARLLSVAEDEAGVHVEVAHEALLVAWPRLVEWRREDLEGARLRDQLRAAALQWQERKRPSGLLWRGDALAELQRWRGRTEGALTDVEAAFVAAAQREDTRGLRIRRMLVLGTIGLLLAALAGALWLSSRTTRERARAVQSLAALHQEQGRLALVAGRPANALAYFAEAQRHGARGTPLQVMIAAAARSVESMRRSLDGHTGGLWSVVYAHDGKLIATAGSDGDARLWRADTGALSHVLRGHGKDVRAIAFSPDDTRIVTTSWDGTARIWDSASGRTLFTLALGHTGLAAAWSPDGSRLVTATGDVDGRGGARLWDARTGALVATFELTSHTAAIAWSRDGRTIATGSGDGARLWDAATATLVGPLATGPNIHHVAFARGDRDLVTARRDGELASWDVATQRRRLDFSGLIKLRSIAVSADGERLAASADAAARVWSLADGKSLGTLTGSDARVNVVAFSPRGDRVLAGAADGSTRIWDLASGTLVALRDGHLGGIHAAAFSSDGAELVTAGADGTARIWSAAPDRAIAIQAVEGKPERVDVDAAGSIATGGRTSPARRWTAQLAPLDTLPPITMNPTFGRDGVIVTPSRDERIRMFAPDGTVVRTFEGQRQPLFVDVSADGRLVASASESDGTARLWSLDGRPAASLVHPTMALSSIAFSPDDRRVVTAGRDGGVRLWNVATAQLEGEMAFSKGWVTGAVFSNDGRRVASSHQEGVVVIWDARTRARLGILEGHAREVSSVRFSADDQLVVTTSGDTTVRIWDATRFKLLLVLAGHGAEVVDAAFTAGDDGVVSASWDGTIRRWEIPRDRRTSAEIEQLVRCRIAVAVDDNGSLAPRPVDPALCTSR